jgi:hypothetical protein
MAATVVVVFPVVTAQATTAAGIDMHRHLLLLLVLKLLLSEGITV